MKKSLLFLLMVTGSAWGADYEVMDRDVAISVESNSFVQEHHREVVRILSQKGSEYRHYLAINSYINVRNVAVSVQFPDGHSERMKDEEILELPIHPSAQMITDLKALVLAPSTLTKGCVVTIEYDRSATSLLYIDSWVYATSVPVLRASCTLRFPLSLPIKYRGQDEGVQVRESGDSLVRTVRFETSNRKEIVLLGSDESQGAMDKRVTFAPERCMTEKWLLSTESWQSVAAWFAELSRYSYQSEPAMDEVVGAIKKQASTPEAVASALYEYIQKTFVYTGVEIGIGGYKPHFTGQTFEKKYGDCKDLSFLYVMLLRKAGIEAFPALVDTRNTRFFYKDFPTPTQFNHCIAYLPGIRNGTWVDSTVKNFLLGEIPAAIQGHQALVIGPNELMEIPARFQESNVVKLTLNGVLSEKQVKMQGDIETSGASSILVDVMRNALMQNTVKHYVYDRTLAQGIPVQNLDTKVTGDRTLALTFITPVYSANPFRIFLINPVNYPALNHLAYEPHAGEYYATGSPIRMVTRCSVDLAAGKLISAPLKVEHNGEFISYKIELAEQGGTLRYLADTYFAN
ncbi:MAG TPA: DUF3857 domain-containing protein, partial [Acidobacteriota bacterium]|nr:DUF3857 domain-containing protein [Acidobacteriota bacterium]